MKKFINSCLLISKAVGEEQSLLVGASVIDTGIKETHKDFKNRLIKKSFHEDLELDDLDVIGSDVKYYMIELAESTYIHTVFINTIPNFD